MNDKGILFSVMTIILCFGVLTLATYYSTLTVRQDIHSEKVTTIFDDVAGDIEDLILMEPDITYRPDETIVEFRDRFSEDFRPGLVNDYEDFLEGIYSQKANTRIGFKPGEPVFMIEPTGMAYEYDSYGKAELWIYNVSGNASHDEIVFRLTAEHELVNVIAESVAGTKQVGFNCSFPNQDYEATLAIAASATSNITFNLSSGQVVFRLGRNVINGGIHDNSLVASSTGAVDWNLETRIVFAENITVGVRSNMSLAIDDEITRVDGVWLTAPVTRGK
ncbi:hypothetical protein ACFLRF_06260 [Candidatus Altiarchaeota archaeon]